MKGSLVVMDLQRIINNLVVHHSTVEDFSKFRLVVLVLRFWFSLTAAAVFSEEALMKHRTQPADTVRDELVNTVEHF